MLGGGGGDVKKVASNSSSDNIVANSIDVAEEEASTSLLETISSLFFFSSATAECSRVVAPSLSTPYDHDIQFVHDDVAVEDDINKDVVRIVKAAECCMIAIVYFCYMSLYVYTPVLYVLILGYCR